MKNKNNIIKNKITILILFLILTILLLTSCTNTIKTINTNNTNATENTTNNNIITKPYNNTTNFTIISIKLVPSKKIYLGAFMDFNNSEDIVTKEKILNFKNVIKKNFSYAYFSNNWKEKIEYPKKEIHIIIEEKMIPFIRIMPDRNDKEILKKINSGIYDKKIEEWFKNAREDYEKTKVPILIDFAVEMNGNWFLWNDSKEYKKAYIRIINISKKQKNNHITWFFHPDINSYSGKPKEYYPGDEYIDWIGVSIYGPQNEYEEYESFEELLKNNYKDIKIFKKPKAILEIGISEGNWNNKTKKTWLENAFKTIKQKKYIDFKILGLWSENWEEENTTAKLRVNSSKESLETYQKNIDETFTDNMIFEYTIKKGNRIIKINKTQKQIIKEYEQKNKQYNNTKKDNEKNKKNNTKKTTAINNNNTNNINNKYYVPKQKVSWHWQLTGKLKEYNVTLYDLDLFETDKTTIEELHKKGKKVICYFNAGAYEPYRPDSKLFKKSVIGKIMQGWEDEKWLNVKDENVKDIMKKRIILASKKGCDGIEPDNIESYKFDTGFNITYKDQLEYNKWLANEAHKNNLSIALKNDLEQIKSLIDYYDFALNEECFYYNECEKLLPFIKKGKAVLNVEYNLELKDFCKKAEEYNFSSLKMEYSLDGKRKSCEEYLQN